MEKLYEIGSAPDGTFVYARAFRHPYTVELPFALVGELVQEIHNLLKSTDKLRRIENG